MSSNNTKSLFLQGRLILPETVQAPETLRYPAANPPTTNISRQKAPRIIPGLSRQNAKAQLYTQDKAGVIRKDAVRVGRNDICPCGSGQKFKNCCGKTPQVTRLSPLPRRKDEDSNLPVRTTNTLDDIVPLQDVFVQLLSTFEEHPEYVYAYLVTGRIITPSTRDACIQEELQEYDTALQCWSEMSPEQHEAERANWATYAQDATTWPYARGSE